MTKKDYIAIAEILKRAKEDCLNAEGIARRIALYMSERNGLFDRPKFLAACGVA